MLWVPMGREYGADTGKGEASPEDADEAEQELDEGGDGSPSGHDGEGDFCWTDWEVAGEGPKAFAEVLVWIGVSVTALRVRCVFAFSPRIDAAAAAAAAAKVCKDSLGRFGEAGLSGVIIEIMLLVVCDKGFRVKWKS